MALTFGGVSTDSITTNLTTDAAQRTYSIWAYRTGDGGGTFGRYFQKTGQGNWNTDGGGFDTFAQTWTTGGNWSYTRPSADAWHHLAVTYNNSDANNDPSIYIDGSLVGSFTAETPRTGSPATNSNQIYVGNGSTGTRNFAGRLCEFAVWDRILSADEVAALAKGFSPLFSPRSLVSYLPLVRTIKDLKDNTAITSSGTVVVEHPRIIYPYNSRP